MLFRERIGFLGAPYLGAPSCHDDLTCTELAFFGKMLDGDARCAMRPWRRNLVVWTDATR